MQKYMDHFYAAQAFVQKKVTPEIARMISPHTITFTFNFSLKKSEGL